MITRISDVIYGWLGWCPQTRTVSRQLPVLHDETADGSAVPGAGTFIRSGLSKRYRNQVLLWAVFFTLVSVPFVAYFQTAELTRVMFSYGMIAGLGVFAFFGRWLWNSFQMLEKGMTIKTKPGEYIILFLIAGAIPLSVVLILAALTVLLSFAGAWAFPAFATGFAFIPWYVFTLILLWERRTGCILMFDKKTNSFTAARCSGNALH